jgi:putative effector of murein hydrolase LrgA (UPF0299 family)
MQVLRLHFVSLRMTIFKVCRLNDDLRRLGRTLMTIFDVWVGTLIDDSMFGANLMMGSMFGSNFMGSVWGVLLLYVILSLSAGNFDCVQPSVWHVSQS